MKVFVSHSSKDKWIARRISEDLEARGVSVFLDEKDIETGASIDVSIQEHLRDSDDCLILLSPASVSSHWVLIELGGALALQKRVVPILLHIGTNEVPQPISKHLARDLNEIEKYYAEVDRRLKGERVPSRPVVESRKAKSPRRSLAVGTRVRIVDKEPALLSEAERLIGWTSEMNAYLGRIAKVVSVDLAPPVTATLDIDEGDFIWSFEWLIPVD
jgi:hypothetical protein